MLKWCLTDYIKKYGYLDRHVIDKAFDDDDRESLEKAKQDHPNSVIRMPNADLIANGRIKGLGGSVPAEWDGSVIQM